MGWLWFQVISKRYEGASTIITTSIAYADWPRIFAGDATLTSALLERLLHHAETVVLDGDSYRGPRRKYRRQGVSIGVRRRAKAPAPSSGDPLLSNRQDPSAFTPALANVGHEPILACIF